MFEILARRRRTADNPGPIRPELALLISTYQKPRHLKLVLASVAMQQDLQGKLEVVVTDDGSTDDTIRIVERFARTVDFPVKLTTHRHRAFQVARCRNEGVAASSAPYIVFLDGDCIIPPDFVWQHLRSRKARVVMNGDCYRLEEETSARIDEAAVRSGDYVDWVSAAERKRVQIADCAARWHNLTFHRWKPHLLGSNIGVWRSDFERVNGFDENFEGWGNEDDDIGYRFRQAKVRVRSILRWTHTYHVWHPRDATWTPNWHDGPNVARLFRKNRATRCLNGLLKLGPAEIARDGDALPFDASDATRIISFPSTDPFARPCRCGVSLRSNGCASRPMVLALLCDVPLANRRGTVQSMRQNQADKVQPGPAESVGAFEFVADFLRRMERRGKRICDARPHGTRNAPLRRGAELKEVAGEEFSRMAMQRVEAGVVALSEARLAECPYYVLRSVLCEFQHGVLTLRGKLPTFYHKQLAQEVVGGLAGVSQVVNQIEVASLATY